MTTAEKNVPLTFYLYNDPSVKDQGSRGTSGSYCSRQTSEFVVSDKISEGLLELSNMALTASSVCFTAGSKLKEAMKKKQKKNLNSLSGNTHRWGSCDVMHT